MAVAWALEKAGVFTLGCPDLLVVTDHQPLTCILGDKSLEDIPNPRLVRLKEKTLRYKFTIQHCPGKWNRGPDAFSRTDLTVGELWCVDGDEFDEEIQVQELAAVHQAVDIPGPGEEGKGILLCPYAAGPGEAGFCNAINEPVMDIPEVVRLGMLDQEYRAVLAAVKSGFPASVDLCSPVLERYYKDRERLSVVAEDDAEVVVFTDSDGNRRLLIPRALRTRIKQVLHADHRRDLTRTKMKANQHVFWPEPEFIEKWIDP